MLEGRPSNKFQGATTMEGMEAMTVSGRYAAARGDEREMGAICDFVMGDIPPSTAGRRTTMAQELFIRPGYVPIPAPNFEETVDWYVQRLGLNLKAKFPDEGRMVAVLSFPAPQATVLLLVESATAGKMGQQVDGRPIPLVALNCVDLEHTRDILMSRGVPVTEIRSHDASNTAKYFYITDPNGQTLEAAWSVWDSEHQ